MDSRSLAEQEKDIRDLLRRAERTPVKTSALRKDTLKRLIDLAHSPHPSLKVIVATNLKYFIKDFPELEDDAINAVYDLCEDPVSSVRIKGYAAIVDVSREQQKWVKRNADVLVQLLQSDEPEEVTFVKRALTQHLDMDPVITLGVICDQVVPPDEPLDEEEQAIRDRLRSLVLAFLAGEAKRSLVERHASAPGSAAEQILVSGLFKAISKLTPSEVDVIVKDILASLPSFRPPSLRGRELLDLLLSQVRAALKTDLPSGAEKGFLQHSRYYLDLASYVAVDRRLAHPSHLLRFYYTNLTTKLVLSRLSEEDQAYVIRRVAEAFAASEDASGRAPPTAPAAETAKRMGNGGDIAEDTALRKQFPDVCAVLLQIFTDMKKADQRPWAACHTLLQGIVRRMRDNRLQIPQHVVGLLRRIEPLQASEDLRTENRAAQQQVHSVIRLLLEPLKPPATPTAQTSASNSVAQGDGQKGNVHNAFANGTFNGAHRNGIAGANAGRGEQRRIMNVNKRKLDAPNGPGSDVQSGSSGSNAAGVPVSPRGPRNGLPAPPTTLPPRPASGNNGAPSAPRVDRQRDRQPPPHLRDRPAATAQPETTAAAGSANTPRRTPPPPADELVSRSAKRARTDGRRGRDGTPSGPGSASNKAHAAGAQSGGSAKPVENATTSHAGESRPIPSLLSRLNATVPNGKAAGGPGPEREPAQRDRGYSRRGMADSEPERPSTDPVVPAKRRAEPDTLSGGPKLPSASGGRAMPPPSVRSRPSRPSPEPDKDPVRGFSIRGAAKAANRPPPSAVEGVASKPATSLLQRLQPLGDGSAVQGSDDGGGRRGRKRGRHA